MTSLRTKKRCTKCRRILPIQHFYIKDKKTRRRYARCKKCHYRITKAWARSKPGYFKECRVARLAANPEKVRQQESEIAKRWRANNLEKARARDRNENLSPERKAKKAAYRKANAERRRAYNAEYRKKNAEKIKASGKRYRDENHDRISEWHRRNYEENGDILKARIKKFKQRNPDLTRWEGRQRYAQIKGAEGSYTEEEWEAVKAAQNYRCLACGKKEPEITLTADHVLPIARGGSNWISNIQGLCGPCNSRKHAKHIDYRNHP